MSRKFTIYALMAPNSDIVRYIGITVKPLSRRLREHILAANRGDRRYLYNWIRSITPETPEIWEIEQTEDREQEKFWIKKFREEGHPITNLTGGGDGAPLGHNFTPEHRAKISAALKDVPKSDEHRQKLSEAKKGTGHSEETRKKISKIVKGRKHSEETKAKIAKSHKGITHTDESKKKISDNRKAKFADGTLISPTQGKKLSAETKAKISESLRIRNAELRESLRDLEQPLMEQEQSDRSKHLPE